MKDTAIKIVTQIQISTGRNDLFKIAVGEVERILREFTGIHFESVDESETSVIKRDIKVGVILEYDDLFNVFRVNAKEHRLEEGRFDTLPDAKQYVLSNW